MRAIGYAGLSSLQVFFRNLDGTDASALSVVGDLGGGDDDADGQAKDEEDERPAERGHVHTPRSVDLQQRAYVGQRALHARHVPALAALREPATLQRLPRSRTLRHTAPRRIGG